MNGQAKLSPGKAAAMKNRHALMCMFKSQYSAPFFYIVFSSSFTHICGFPAYRYATESIKAACNWAYKDVHEDSVLEGNIIACC